METLVKYIVSYSWAIDTIIWTRLFDTMPKKYIYHLCIPIHIADKIVIIWLVKSQGGFQGGYSTINVLS